MNLWNLEICFTILQTGGGGGDNRDMVSRRGARNTGVYIELRELSVYPGIVRIGRKEGKRDNGYLRASLPH